MLKVELTASFANKEYPATVEGLRTLLADIETLHIDRGDSQIHVELTHCGEGIYNADVSWQEERRG